jgi:DNA-binding response OmpR family regulator
MGHTIVVIEDEEAIASAIAARLESAGYAVKTAGDGPEGVALVESVQPSLVVLDLMLPGIDGLEVCRLIQRDRRVPVLMLTARDTETDLLVGLGVGADDYMTKPFSPRELVARVRAVLRRVDRAAEPADHLRVGDLELDVPRLRTTVAGRSIDLTATEFSILATMAREPGRVFTRSQLLDAVHGVAFEAYERAIDAHVKNIRRKLEPEPARPRYLETVYGVGYRVADPDPAIDAGSRD